MGTDGVHLLPWFTLASCSPAAVLVPREYPPFAVLGRTGGPTRAGEEGSTVDWDALARLGGTLVLLMAVGRLAECAEALISGGLAASTPVAVIRDGSLPSQQVVVSTLASVAVDAAHLTAPAVVVVGDVVSARLLP